MLRLHLALALVGVTASTTNLHADTPLTLDGALALARERAPTTQAAWLRVDEARGRLVGARRLLGENPIVAGALGRRFAGSGPDQGLEGRAEVMQPLEVSGQRRARVEAASAVVSAASAEADGTVRALEADVAAAFFAALASSERQKIAVAAQEATGQAVRALERRHQLGDVPVLDVNVARAANARARAQARAAQASRADALGDLRQLLGLAPDEPLDLTGDLRQPRRYEIEALAARAQDRPDVRALLAEAREADAEVALGRAQRWPRLGVGGSYERHEGADIVLGAVSVELPLFSRGQDLRAAGAARASRLKLEADARRRSAIAAVRAAYLVYGEHLQGARALAEALPLAEENESLARKSYEAGQLSLADWLVVRREALDTRLEYVDHLLATALAGVSLAASAGVSP